MVAVGTCGSGVGTWGWQCCGSPLPPRDGQVTGQDPAPAQAWRIRLPPVLLIAGADGNRAFPRLNGFGGIFCRYCSLQETAIGVRASGTM